MTRKLSRLWILMLLALPVALLLDGCGSDDPPLPPPQGACCFADDSCEVLTQAACTADAGTWQGADTSCDPNPCGMVPPPEGACCFADDSCQVLTEAACTADAGTWQGADTSCDPNPCGMVPPPEGACCFADDSCQVLAEDACVAATGVWQGAGTGCDPNPCGTVPTGSISFSFDGTEYTSTTCMANYFPVEDETEITAGEVDWTLTLDFPGNSTGDYDATAANLVFPLTAVAYELEAIDVTVTAYGAIGEAITGTFSGTLANLVDPADVKAITGGVFSAERGPDVF